MNDLLDAMNSRLKSPYFGYALLAFFGLNWKALFILAASSSTPQLRVAEFEMMTSFWTLAILPLTVGAAVAFATPWIRFGFAHVARKPMELAEDIQLLAENRKLTRQTQLEKARSLQFAAKETELIERAKRDEQVATIEDEETKQRVSNELKSLRLRRDNLSARAADRDGLLNPSIELLIAAASNNGRILRLKTLSGTSIQVGKIEFGADSPQHFAMYDEALDRLVNLQFAKSAGSGGQIFELTNAGWEAAGKL